MSTLEISKFSDAKQWLKLKFKCQFCKGPLQSNMLTCDAKSVHGDHRSLRAQA